MLLINLLSEDRAALNEDSEDEYEARRKSTMRAHQSPVSVSQKEDDLQLTEPGRRLYNKQLIHNPFSK
jgi:hypothetical protein